MGRWISLQSKEIGRARPPVRVGRKFAFRRLILRGQPEAEEGEAKMATKKAKKPSKQLRKAKKLEATKSLIVQRYPNDPI
jgi:hypothetical protein